MAQNSKIGVMKANQSFCCGFCFEGSSRDELSTISYLTMKGCVVSACDFQTGYFRRRVFGEERHSCEVHSLLFIRIIFTRIKAQKLRLEIKNTSARREKTYENCATAFVYNFSKPAGPKITTSCGSLRLMGP